MRNRKGPRAHKRVAARSKNRRSATGKTRRAELRPKRRRRVSKTRQVGTHRRRLEHPNGGNNGRRRVNYRRDERERKRNVICRRENVRTPGIVVGLRRWGRHGLAAFAAHVGAGHSTAPHRHGTNAGCCVHAASHWARPNRSRHHRGEHRQKCQNRKGNPQPRFHRS